MKARFFMITLFASLLLVLAVVAVTLGIKEESASITWFSMVSTWLPLLVVFFTGLGIGAWLLASKNTNSLAVGALAAFVIHLPFYIILTYMKTTESMQQFLVFYGEETNVAGIETIISPTWGEIIQGYFTELLILLFVGSIGTWLGKKLLNKHVPADKTHTA